MADGVNEHVRVFNRQTMEEVYNFGYGGRQPGMFLGVHSIAVDSQRQHLHDRNLHRQAPAALPGQGHGRGAEERASALAHQPVDK